MKLPLSLRWSEEPQGKPCAWLIAGDSTREWLVELARWEMPLARLEVLHVSRAQASAAGDGAAACGGLLVIPPPGTTPPRGARAVAFRRLADRLYLPLDAAISPDVTERELADLLPGHDTWFVWRPGTGLLAFGREEILRVRDLLAPLARSPGAWDRALPGVAINRRLVSIAPLEQLSLEQLLADARGDIGSQSPDGLPPRPQESPGAWENLRQSARRQAGRLISWLTQVPGVGGMAIPGASAAGRPGMPGGSGGGGGRPVQTPGWLESLRNWAQQQRQEWNERLSEARNRELLRLLDMLKNRPDEGLRFAIPFSGGEAGRGLAPPGASLVSRNVDFSLSGLRGGSGAADVWNIDDRYRRELTEQYRALASREIALGRYRRAAYIFAELLNDLRAAAATLEKGKHYREAAVLYQERLHQVRDAARCLCQGGLWTEAIALYEKLGDHEQVGDLYAQLEEREQACAAWKRAIEIKRRSRDHLGAFELWHNKVRDPEAAYQELLSGWPGSGQAEKCLDRAFELLGGLGRHDEAQRMVGVLPETVAGAQRTRMLVERLAHVATHYPDASTRACAADQTRVLAARCLEGASLEEVPPLTEALRSLAVGDRVLGRDCRRFADLRRMSQAAQMARQFARPSRQISLVRKIAFDEPSPPWAALSSGKGFYVVGPAQDGTLSFTRGCYDGQHHRLKLNGHGFGALLAACQHTSTLYFHPLGVRMNEGRDALAGQFADPGGWLLALDRVATHRSFDPMTIGIAAEGGRLVSVYAGEANDLVVINTFLTREQKLASSYTLPIGPPEAPIARPLPILLRGGILHLGFGSRLAVHDGTRVDWIELDRPIQGICGSRAFTRDRIVVLQDDGAELIWGIRPDSPRERFAQGMADARAAFTDGGWLVAANRQEIQAYHSSHAASANRLTWLATAQGPGSDVVAVLPTNEPNEIALCTEASEIRVYRLPNP